MKQQILQSVTDRNWAIVEKIQLIKQERPFWGYRRVWACLVCEVHGEWN